MTPRQQLFLIECRMTCVGGSEKGTCECRRPIDCKVQDDPDYPYHREQATKRMHQALLEAILDTPN